MNPILAVILLAIVGVVSDFFIKLAGQGPKFMDVKWFVIGSLISMISIVGWFYVMKHIKLSSLSLIFSLVTVLLLVGISVFYFHEKLNVYEVVGIITAIVSFILLSRFV